ncbi:MAG: C40 family peptidase [Candidatus Coatesbacteria bacterium]|nr:MAG: C40 family peptidase [Candidatus Coatesbacteria bacterium]
MRIALLLLAAACCVSPPTALAGDAWLAAVRYDQAENAVYLDTTGPTPPAVEIVGGAGISLALEGLRVRPSPYSLAPADGVIETITASEEKTQHGWRVLFEITTAAAFPYEIETRSLGEDASQIYVQLKEVDVERTKPDTSGKVAVLTRPTADAPPVAYLEYHTLVAIIGREQGYYMVRLPDDRIGWVPEKNVRLEDETEYEPADVGDVGELRADVIASGKKYLGKPYVWGGTGPDGFDCSGLMQTIFAENGIGIPRGAKDQYKEARKIKRDELWPGDLIFFETYAKGVSHVGIWVGDGKFLHAESSDAGVTITPISIPYWDNRYYGAATYFDD